MRSRSYAEKLRTLRHDFIAKEGLAKTRGRAGLWLARHLYHLGAFLRIPDALAAYRRGVDVDLYALLVAVRENFSVGTIIDVGANRGTFCIACAFAFPDTPIFAFEPLPGPRSDLEELARTNPQIKVFEAALGDHVGDVELHENEFSPSSSVLTMQPRHIELWPKTSASATRTVKMETLGNVLLKEQWKPPLFIKIDVQGLELPVLHGASTLLEQTAILLVEVLFEELYEGQTDFPSLVRFLSSHDLHFRGIVKDFRVKSLSLPIYADALFVNRQWLGMQVS